MSCASREIKSVWFYLFGYWKNYGGRGNRWRGWDLFTRRWWRNGSEYIFHDSIGRYFNQFIKCKITGHKNTRDIACSGELPRTHCFDCERDITE